MRGRVRRGIILRKRAYCDLLRFDDKDRPSCSGSTRCSEIHRYSPCELWHGGFKKPFPIHPNLKCDKAHIFEFKDNKPRCYRGKDVDLDQILGLTQPRSDRFDVLGSRI